VLVIIFLCVFFYRLFYYLFFSHEPRFSPEKFFFVFTRDEIDVLPQNQTEKKIIKNNNNNKNNQSKSIMNEDEDQMNNSDQQILYKLNKQQSRRADTLNTKFPENDLEKLAAISRSGL
jgi:hypothetical protein